jgi:DNA adenine methylase
MIVIEGSNKSLAALRKLNFVEKKFKLPRGWHNSPKGPDKSFVWASIFMNYQPNMLAAKKFFMPVMKVETVDITVSGKSLRMNHQKALEKSRDLIRHTKMEMALGFVADLVLSEDLICKRSDRLFPSTAGKCHIASRLLCLFPDHNGYIEPFAGGAALFFAKEKKPVEALNDTHAAVMTCYKFVQNITQEQINKLKKMNWVATRDHRKKLQESSPTDPLLIFHRLTMLRFSGFNKNENSKGMAREQEGKELKIIDRLIGAKERLKNTKLYCGDYRKIMSKYDGMKDIFFFLDPPYVNANVADIGVKEFDHKAFWECVYNLKSKYLVAYNQRDPEKKLGVKKIKHLAASNIGSKEYITYVLTNYDIQKESSVWRGFTKNQSEAIAFLPSDIQDNLRKINATIEKCLEVKLIPIDKKAPDDKQIAFGVVLEPNEVDSQGDIIPEAEIEKAAHLWLARYQDRGFMHDKIVNSKIEIYESYIAPTNLNINGQQVKKGTWLLMYHILDSELWKKIKSGEQTGFSMGGFARRVKV